MEHPQEPVLEDAVSPLGGMDKQLGNLSLQDKKPPYRKKSFQAVSNLTIQPTPYFNPQTPIFTSPALTSPLGSPNFERSYLLENLQRQHDRGERLSYALSNVEVKLSAAQTKGDARKLRKEVGLLRSKIAESRRQVQLIMLRLGDLQNEELGRRGMFPGQAAGVGMPGVFSYPTYWTPCPPLQPFANMAMPLVPPLSPISPLTPIPPSLYHTSPTMAGPFDPSQWMQPQYQLLSPTMSFSPGYDQTLTNGNDQQQPFAQEQNDPTPSRKASFSHQSRPMAARHKSVDFSLAKDASYDGRRWSLADTFSPTPKDKRMSMPGLQTIWKDKDREEQPEEE